MSSDPEIVDLAKLCTAIMLAIAAVACEPVIGAWAAAWAYLVAVGLAAWTRSWVAVPIAIAGLMAQGSRCGVTLPTVAASGVQAVILTLVIAVVRRARYAAPR